MGDAMTKETLKANRSAEVFLFDGCSTTDLADELCVLYSSSHHIYAIVLGKFTHVLFVFTQFNNLQVLDQYIVSFVISIGTCI